ncbi:cobaltochelatase [Desulfosarcina variabilis str. Montpellier]|uniref:cobaltochelatase subunit CobN n=1 Tax=Desulfosarcina variabilis TaxID=2300 RepID=UPI003AFAE86C
MPIKLCVVAWKSHLPLLVKVARSLDWLDISAHVSTELADDPLKLEAAIEEIKHADLVFFYRSSEGFWEAIEKELAEGTDAPVVCIGHDPSLWTLSSTPLATVSRCYDYFTLGGEENYTNMLRFMGAEVLGQQVSYDPPVPVPWEGFYHPRADVNHFDSLEAYLAWYDPGSAPVVGVLISRHYWVSGSLTVEDAIIMALEARGLNVIPVFSYSVRDKGLGTRSSGEVVRDVFLKPDGTCRIDALVKLQPFFLESQAGQDMSDGRHATPGVRLLETLDVPIFGPITAYYKTIEEWEVDDQGIGNGIAWSVAMPEFEGVIEPMIVGGGKRIDDQAGGEALEERQPIHERCRRLAARVAQWVRLRRTLVAERKVAFVLHNNPCASMEATVGVGAHLDTLESVACILHRMQAAGYRVTPPEDGKDLIDTIMEKKAISEFRWTTVDEIVSKGGTLGRVSLDDYLKWWETFPAKTKKRISEAWGNPPGEELNGIPPAMVYENTILVTGVDYGNAVVCVQPKRGCAGPKCDGRVCKILHDPDVPPPHQYLATYRYIEDTFAAHVVVHVGTHGNLEFLPGKGVGLSESCLPDLSIHTLPHLYIYNADNPPEGTIAKRRSLATLVDHMQTVMQQGGLYEGLEELDRLLGEYEQAKLTDRGRAHTLVHMIMDSIEKTDLAREIGLDPDEPSDVPIEETLRRTHEALSRIRNTQIQDGMHIFGQIPEGERRIDFINAILRFDAGETISLRKMLCRAMGLDLGVLLKDQGVINDAFGMSHGQLLEKIDSLGRQAIAAILASSNGQLRQQITGLLGDRLQDETALDPLDIIRERIVDLTKRIDESTEIDALMHGFQGGYIPSGPSGLITRGRDDILPTGRNFFSLDPEKVPTQAAYKVGEKLAVALIKKHAAEEGRTPENVAIFWMCTDIMWSDGEGMGQIMSLIGVRPRWLPNGKVRGFDVIPLEDLGRPRIDVTIRASGISRDNFPNCLELVDEAVHAVASLDEPEEMNFIRKHALEKIQEENSPEEDRQAWRRATYRVFSSKPGTYMPGVNLAVYASAWKDEADLADIFVYWNGYTYGKKVFGEESQRELIHSLKSVDVTFNKVVTDEYDLFGCCCYFGTHGGMTAAARNISGRPVKSYYGDTREPEHIAVTDLADEIRRVVRTKLLNPKWIEGMKRHGYKGAGDISGRVGRVYGWEATTQEVDDWIFDDIARTFMLDPENREFFEKNNPWALEEIGRRLLEAEGRGLWQADPEVLEALKERYLEVEGWIEDTMGDVQGEFQGGSIDILTTEEVGNWEVMMKEVKEKMRAARPPQ